MAAPARLIRMQRLRPAIRHGLALGLVLLLWAIPDGARGAPRPSGTPLVGGVAANCRDAITPEMAQRVFQSLNVPAATPACVFDGVATETSSMVARWKVNGAKLPDVEITPRACAVEPAAGDSPFVVSVPPELAAQCPDAAKRAAGIADVLGRPAIVDVPGAPAAPFDRTVVFFGLALLVLGAAAARELRRVWREDRAWGGLLLAAFVVSVAVRAIVPRTITNWYSEVLPATGPPGWMRFGPGIFAWQALLRLVAPWDERTLFASQILLGALAVPLFLVVVRSLELPVRVAAALAVLFALAPFHFRISASTSEHVFSSTVTIALLAAWLGWTRRRDPLLLVVTLLLIPMAALTRPEVFTQLALVPLWTLLHDRCESRPLRWRESAAGYAAYAVVVAGSALIVYFVVVVPSHHPRPEPTAMWAAARAALPEYWRLATHAPGWIPLVTVLLALIGLVPMARLRPWLLARVGLTLLLSFTLLGRTFANDELVSARYFLVTLPVFLLLSAFGFDFLLAITIDRWPRARVPATVLGLAVIAGLNVQGSREAFSVAYAFQDEYAFLRGALAQLPAGCLVYELPLRDPTFDDDLDCCLDLPRSPIALRFPELKLRSLPVEEFEKVDRDAACVAYYESSACSLADSGELHAHWGRAIEYFHRRCEAIRRESGLVPLASTTVSARATNDFFRAQPARVTLYRWSRPAPAALATPR